MHYAKSLTSLFALILSVSLANAQSTSENEQSADNQLTKDVDVVNVYQPTLHKARKLRIPPLLDDTAKYRPKFTYTTISRISSVTTKPDSLSAASMSFPVYDSPYHTLVEGAIGYAPTIFGQIFYNTGSSKTQHLALRAGHLAQLGKVKLSDDSKVKAPQNDTWASLAFHRLYTRNRFGINFDFRNSAYRYYGLNTITDTLEYYNVDGTSLFGSDICNTTRQRNTTVDVDLQVANAMADTEEDISYAINGGFGLFFNRSGVRQTNVGAQCKLLFPFSKYSSAIDAVVGFNYFRTTTPVGEDTLTMSYFDRHGCDIHIYPHYEMIKDFMKLQLGLRIIAVVGDDNVSDDFIVQPDLLTNFFIGDGSVRFYAGLTGDYKQNSYRSLVAENRYLSPDSRMYVYSAADKAFVSRTAIRPSQSPILFKIGIRSSFSRHVQLHVGMDYRSLGDENIFVNRSYISTDSTTHAHSSQFALLQDDGKLLRVHTEVNVNPTDNSNVLLRATFFNYDMNYLQAWNKPQFKFEATTRFHPTDRLTVRADLTFMGKRDAYSPTLMQNETLKQYVDLNIGADYYISNQFTTFIDMNNLAASDQMQWLGYSSRRVNILAGIRYKF